ncbi:hypothetical protein EO087_03830 [Dyella sp. M7H15-1]|uniref:hypothetical protein n=1 Tax=Dyella sp. M7H15-1 TaxID=2501295 RepID=UPI001005100F|nr:hypothetical protein [Dyella sp. M7H15-1]QAU23223.1 hypothetical protein EO087_03830 [Dyella sp. M7H15-1]
MSRFNVPKPTVDPAKLAAFAGGAETREPMTTVLAPVVQSPAPAAPTAQAQVQPVMAAARGKDKGLPRSILIRLDDQPELAEKLQDVFQRSTYKSQQQLVVALLNEGLDRLRDGLR